MKEKFKVKSTKVISLLLSIMMLVSIIPSGMITAKASKEIDITTFNERITNFRKTYYHGKKYDNTYSKECFGYANHIAAYVFGSYPAKDMSGYVLNDNWSRTYGASAVDNLHAGDVVRYLGHSIFITGISGNNVYYTDANSDRNNTIKWDRKTTKSVLRSKVSNYLTSGESYYDPLHRTYRGWVAHYKYWTDQQNIKINVSVTNKTNNTADFKVSISPKSKVSRIGIYYGTNKNSINSITTSTDHKTTSKYNYKRLYYSETGVTASEFPNKNVKLKTVGDLKIKTTYYYKIIALINGKWQISKDTFSFTTKNDPPKAVTNLKTVKLIDDEKNYPLGCKPTVKWSASTLAASYTVEVYNPSGNKIENKTGITKTEYTIKTALNTAGTYKVKVIAVNQAGSVAQNPYSFNIKPNSTLTFDYADGKTEPQRIKNIKYGDSRKTPPTPTRTGYKFITWKTGNTKVGANTEIKKIKADATYTAVWEANKYNVKFVDGYNNDVIFSNKYTFGTTVDLNDYPEPPSHDNYAFEGWSEDNYIVEAGVHTIYARYKWNAPHGISTQITNISRAKSSQSLTENDGYSIDVQVKAPSIDSSDNAQTIKGRVIIALKTSSGRLLIQTESAAFVIYPNQTNEVNKTINVFVPYEASDEALPTVIEAYVVNNFESSGIISNIASNNEKLLEANGGEWTFTNETVEKGKTLANGDVVAATDESQDYNEYTKTITTTQESLNTSLSGFNYVTCNWINVDGGSDYDIKYVKSWPKLGSAVGCCFNNTSGSAGENLFKTYNKTPKTVTTGATTRFTQTQNSVCGYIYYHWCRGKNNGELQHWVRNNRKETDTGNYKVFEAFYSTINLPLVKWTDNVTDFYCAKGTTLESKSKDSYMWFRIPVYKQRWWEDRKVSTFRKIDTSVVKAKTTPSTVPVNTTSDQKVTSTSNKLSKTITLNKNVTTSYALKNSFYAYKAENLNISHEDKNMYNISADLGEENAGKKVTLYVYKDVQLADYTTEFIGEVITDDEGKINLSNVQMREKCSAKTGDYTIAVSLPNETNSIVVGKIEAPKPTYTVTFQAAITNNSNGNESGENGEEGDESGEEGDVETVIHTISTQEVTEGGTAELPDESLIPEIEGYHFVGWSQSVVNVNDNLVVEAEYEKNEYAVVFVDWENQNINIERFEYGDTIEPIELPETDETTEVQWAIFNKDSDESQSLQEFTDNGGVVTADMVIAAEYSAKKYEVDVIDFTDDLNSNVGKEINLNSSDIDNYNQNTVTYEHGEILLLEDYEEEYGDGVIIAGWKNAATGKYIENAEITDDIVIYPDYIFTETCENPNSSVTTGEYSSAQNVKLTCSTSNSSIYYTLDGTNPVTSSTAKKYTSLTPITVSSPKVLKFYAKANNMNNSEVVTELLAVNSVLMNKYHIVTVDSNIYQEEESAYQTIVKEGTTLNGGTFIDEYGYNFEGLYYDAEFNHRFDESEPVNEQLTLYAKYTPKNYTATFVDGNGNTLATKTGAYLTSIEAPSVTAPVGFVFSGWDSYDFECIYEDKTFTAMYTPVDLYTTVTLEQTEEIHLQSGSSKMLSANFSTGEINTNDVTWESSNWNVAHVDNEGVVTGVAAGEATISVTVDENNESAEVDVVVFNSPYDCKEHKEVIDEGYPATCTTSGLTDGKHCELCGTVIEKQEVIEPFGHQYETTVKESNCTNQGSITFECSICGDTYTTNFGNEKGHIEEILEEVKPTCTKSGLTEGKRCVVCGEVTVPQEEIEPTGVHSYERNQIEPTCTESGYTVYTCSICGDSYKADYAKALGHVEVTDVAVPATFTAAGKTQGKHCLVCGEVIVPQKSVAKLGFTKISKIKASKGAFTVNWNAVNNVDGYQVQYSLKNNMKKSKVVNVKGASKKAVTVKKLNVKNTYYVRIRAYKKINGKVKYSKWSAVKKIKTK